MSQVSYGTITITDTTDIERIYPVYCKGGESQAPNLTPLSNWSEDVSQAGGQGDYIWQRIVVQKNGIAVTAADYSDAVRLTGLEGEDGRGIASITIQYGTSADWNTEPNNWAADPPTYNAETPKYWTKTTINYNMGIPTVKTTKDQALTEAIYNSVMAQSLSQDANENAHGALSQAIHVDTLLGGHFLWHGTNLGSSTAAGARVIQQVKNSNNVDVSNDPTQWLHNVNIGANGIQLRYNELVMAQLKMDTTNGSALTFYNPSVSTQGNKLMELTGTELNFFNASGAKTSTFGNSISLGSNGATITLGIPNTGSGTILNSNGLEIKYAGISRAFFGTQNNSGYSRLGASTGSRLEMKNTGITLNDANDNNYFKCGVISTNFETLILDEEVEIEGTSSSNITITGEYRNDYGTTFKLYYNNELVTASTTYYQWSLDSTTDVLTVTCKATIAGGTWDEGTNSFKVTAVYSSEATANSAQLIFGEHNLLSSEDFGPRSVTLGQSCQASGINSFAQGSGCIASGVESHAEGSDNKAIGSYSHAEGGDTIASSSCSHTEGRFTTASGGYSHAEGYRAIASGSISHAEGQSTSASGANSHAEGVRTESSGDGAHAEGYRVIASGIGSHAEGYATSPYSITAARAGSHAEGYADDANVLSDGFGAHAEGSGTTATGTGAHAEGYHTIASGVGTHAEGQSTSASHGAHAEGSRTTASGDYSHSEGYYTVASGYGSHTGGNHTVAGYSYQTAIGEYNNNKFGDLFEIGNGTSDDARLNVFEVDTSGNVNIKSGAKYKIAGTALSASDVSAVPTTRTVNSKALSSDITLSASDVSAVPTTRTVNSKALSSDITLSASDVSAVPTTSVTTSGESGKIPQMSASGVLELRKYIDLHDTNSSRDYDARLYVTEGSAVGGGTLTADCSKLIVSGNVNITGNLTKNNNTYIVTAEYNTDNTSVPITSLSNISVTMTKTNYTLLGVVGISMANGSSNGSGVGNCTIRNFDVSGNTVTVAVYNKGSTAAKIKVVVRGLYIAS